MKVKILALVAVLTLSLFCCSAHAQGTAFTYQGHLVDAGTAANGNYDLRFGLFTNVSTGTQVGSLQTNAATAVTNGLFTTTLNFSNVFNGSAYWLEIGVRPSGTTNAFVTLTPRQPITPTPYAITASNLTGTLPASQLTGALPAAVVSGTFSNSVSFTNITNIFAGNGSGLTNVPGISASNHVYAYDTTSQAIVSAGSYQNISLNTGTLSGWFVPTPGQFVAGQSGTYMVQYQAQFANGSPSTTFSACIRGVLNLTSTPSEITGSESVVYAAPATIMPVSRTFLITMTTGQMISFQMAGTIANGSSGGYLISSTFYSQFFPSISVTITRIQ